MRLKKLATIGLMLASSQVSLLQGLEPEVVIDISGGWRNDEVKFSHKLFDTYGNSNGKEHIKFKDMNIWEIGGKGYVSYCNWYLRANGYAGWGDDGHVTINDKGDCNANVASGANSGRLRHKIHDINTADFTVGVGYFFDSNMFSRLCGGNDCCGDEWECCPSQFSWGIAPVVGWSYDWLKVKSKHRNHCQQPVYSDDCSYSDYTYSDSSGGTDFKHDGTFRWEGPFLGFDVAFSYCQWSFDLGYEYHWACYHNRERFDLNTLNVNNAYVNDGCNNTLSRTMKSDDAYGNVVYFDGRYTLCSNWDIGLGVKFSDYTARHPHAKRNNGGSSCSDPCSDDYSYSSCSDYSYSSCSDSSSSRDRGRDARWCSTQVTVDVGYTF